MDIGYPCPIPMVRGGGEGTMGMCAMEVLSLMVGEDVGGKPNDVVPSVDFNLNRLVILANDIQIEGLSDTERADALWVRLPRIIGTAAHTMNPTLFALILGERLGYKSPNLSLGTMVREYAMVSRTPRVFAWGRVLEALDIAIDTWWEAAHRSPRREFTKEEVASLARYLLENKNNSFLYRGDFDPRELPALAAV